MSASAFSATHPRQATPPRSMAEETEMGRIVVINQVTAGRVMQGPGRPDEDTRDGFGQGGATGRSPAATVPWSPRWANGWVGIGCFSFGRRTYEDLLASWNAQGGPFKEKPWNSAPKYVASNNPATEPRLGPTRRCCSGDVLAAVADLKASSGANLVIMGSGVLIGSLLPADLIDESTCC